MTTQPPPGYRLLNPNEIIQRHDLCLFGEQWLPVRIAIGARYERDWHDPTARKIVDDGAEKPCKVEAQKT